MKQRPSDSVMSAVVSAIAAIDADPTAPRTKEHLGRLADIAHATIQRAFKHDAENSSPFKINERWNAVTDHSATQRSPVQADTAKLKAELTEAKREITALKANLNTAVAISAGAWLSALSEGSTVTPMRRRGRSS